MGEESSSVTTVRSFDEAIATRTAKIGIIGLGYAGLPLAVGFADSGFDVLGIDLDPDRVGSVNACRSYLTDMSDDDLSGLEHRVSAATNYDRVSEASAFIICVPTPLSKTRTPDLSYVVAAVEAVAARLVPGQLVVLQSTTVPGTTDELLVSALERATGGTVGRDFFVGYAPERVDPANRAGWTLHTTPKLVSGVTPECARRTALLFEQVCETVIPCALAAGGRAGEALREHVPAGEHRPRQRARADVPAARRVGLGGHRRRGDQALRVPAPLPRPRPRRRLHPGRAPLPVLPAARVRLPDAHDRRRPRDQHRDAGASSPTSSSAP